MSILVTLSPNWDIFIKSLLSGFMKLCNKGGKKLKELEVLGDTKGSFFQILKETGLVQT